MKLSMYNASRLISMLILLILFSQCRKDETTTKVVDSTLVMDHEEVSFLIVVVDEEGELLSETAMSLADDAQDYTPDERGIYVLDDIDVPDIGRRFTVTKEGYHSQIKMLSGRSNSNNVIEVVLIKETEGITINTGEAGSIDGAGILRLPSQLSTADGGVYSGLVKVQSHYYDPDNENYIQQGPGNMLGLTSNNEYVLLGSLGMYLIELSNPDTGEELSIPEGSSATLSFPIADSQLGDVPDRIPLWSMDEELGIWIYEGEANLVDDMMVANVSHFSWWNCDLPYDFIPFCATFVTFSGESVSGLDVSAYVNGSQGFGNDITDDNGKICGKLPKEQLVDLVVRYDNEELGTFPIGPFTDAPIDITIEISSEAVVIGRAVDCNMMSITDGYGIVNKTNAVFPIVLDADGAFIYPLAEEDHSLLLVNKATNEFEEVDITASTDNILLGDVQVCNQLEVGRIYGKVMLDENEDGVSDIPVQGVEVLVRNVITQDIDFTIVSDEDGIYSVMVIPNVEYELFIAEMSDRKVMFQGDLTPEDNLDKEEWTSITRDGNGIAARLEGVNEIDLDNDFQLVNNGIGEVKGFVMRDSDFDGVGDIGVENISLSIISNTQGTVKETNVITDSDGSYSVMMPNFIGKIEINQGSISDYDMSADPDGDDSALGANNEIPIILSNSEVDEDNNFTLDVGKITGSVLEDIDDDGIGDIELVNFTVELYNGNQTSITAQMLVDGTYEFDNLMPGDYYVKVVDNNPSQSYDNRNSQDFTNDDEIDNDDDSGVTTDSWIPVKLDAIEHDADNNFVLGLSAESISGNVSEDTDNDGLGDTPIEGVSIWLSDLSGAIVASVITDENGNYIFNDLLPGDYILTEQDESELDADYVDVFDGDETPEDANDAVDGAKDDIINVTLEIGEHDADNNFLEIQHGTISGSVLIDTDGDDIGDTPNVGQSILLINNQSGVEFTSVTDENGEYIFESLSPNDYTVFYTTPTGYVAVFDGDETPEDANDAVDSLNDGRIEVGLDPGEDDKDNNFIDRPE